MFFSHEKKIFSVAKCLYSRKEEKLKYCQNKITLILAAVNKQRYCYSICTVCMHSYVDDKIVPLIQRAIIKQSYEKKGCDFCLKLHQSGFKKNLYYIKIYLTVDKH